VSTSRVRNRSLKNSAGIVRPAKWEESWKLSLYKILFHFRALLREYIILRLPPPTCKAYPIAILSHDYSAICAPPPTPRFMPYTIQYW